MTKDCRFWQLAIKAETKAYIFWISYNFFQGELFLTALFKFCSSNYLHGMKNIEIRPIRPYWILVSVD